MRRRDFITLLGGAAAWPVVVRAQQPSMAVVGLLMAVTPPDARAAAFRRGLAEAGLVEGQNIIIQRRSAEGDYSRLPALAAELIRDRAAVIAVNSTVAVRAAKSATNKIPIVFAIGSDPIRDGLVESFSRPTGNITGVTFFAYLLTAKQIELLHVLVPSASTLGLLLNPENTSADLVLSDARSATEKLGLRLVIVTASKPNEIEPAFAELLRQQVTALFLAGEAFLTSWRNQIAALALRHKMATCFASRYWAEAGGLLSYGADRTDSERQAGLYVARLLKGEKVADLPVVQPTKFEMVINLKTAKALGLTIPPTLLALADEVVE